MAKHTIATTLLDFLRANAASPPEQRCETMVATRLSSDFRGFRRVMKVVNDLAYKGTIKREHVDNWACVLSLPEVIEEQAGDRERMSDGSHC
jgi:hypothetical protein